ncbi:MAG: hypothetical protein ACI9F9_002698 [Candidatus Paceibacteria bacterium]|jgi:hypothetical protein
MTVHENSTPAEQTLAAGWSALRRAFDWMLQFDAGGGRVICPEHQVEHGGKNAGLIVIALELAKRTQGQEREDLHEVALQQGERLVSNLVREDTSPCFTFRPGRHDPFNCSNSVIDGGAASDALGALVRGLEHECPQERLVPMREASLKHARTYLRYAILDKGVPAQRAWGLTGLASAWALEEDPVLMEAALGAYGLLAGIQHPDGSYPYHPLPWGAGHAGASDVSAYYQSRVTAFGLHALQDLQLEGDDLPDLGAFRRGLDFLLGLQGPDGIKCGLVEAKPWYWGATYEVASHPFDVAALAFGWKRFGDERYAQGALRGLQAWSAHLDSNGSPRSHLPGHGRSRSYQCPVFWAGHAMWLARALPILELYVTEAPGATEPFPLLQSFEDAALYRLEDERVVAWVRAGRPGVNVSHGSPHGAGLIRVLRKSDGLELLPRCRLGGHQAGEWCGVQGLPSLSRGLRAGGKEVRFSLWLARVHWRAGRSLDALRTPFATFRRGVLAFAHGRVSSAFHLSPEVHSDQAGRVHLSSCLAWRDGSPAPHTTIEREFSVDGKGLLVQERWTGRPMNSGMQYQVPELATEVERSATEIRYRLS